MSSHTRAVTALALVVLVVLAGCSGGGGAGGGEVASNGGGAGASGGDGGAADEGAGASDGRADSGQIGSGEALQSRPVRIKTGRAQLEVGNVSTASENLTRATRRLGGYVSASSATTQEIDGENRTTGRLVLRVPRRNFSALFGRVKAAGAVQNSDSNTTDVSRQLVDLRARLNNSRAQRNRLRSLYANASDTQATLEVQKRLSTVQSRIERLEGQLQSLRGQVAYSTITVDLAESVPEQPNEQWYDVGVIGAFLSSVGGVVTALRALVVGLAYLAPYLLVFGLPLSVVGYVAYRWRAERSGLE
ncbi:DUF4349 domain-containing protein [Halococcus sediminicola]|uniref:DUF4349 domain-containing protein n=1 Tax=Halococcus sediminicola TaxID=1264579 RepID=UPI000678E5C9|nr:DUF4349 domain-containing protein [Halococcus sediminicola]